MSSSGIQLIIYFNFGLMFLFVFPFMALLALKFIRGFMPSRND